MCLVAFRKPGPLKIVRLETQKQLKLNYDNLKIKIGIVVIYQNIFLLREKIKYIVKDEWYSRGDVLILPKRFHHLMKYTKLKAFTKQFVATNRLALEV